MLGVDTFCIGADDLFENAFVGFVCVGKLVFIVNVVGYGLVGVSVVVFRLEVFR